MVRGPSPERGRLRWEGGWQAPDGLSPTPQAPLGRRARSWARCGAWAPWPGRWGPWWPPQVRAVGRHSCSPAGQAPGVGLPQLPTSAPACWGAAAHGPAAVPRPGRSAGPGGPVTLCLRSVLAGGRAGLLHRERRALPAPLPPPAGPGGPGADAQGRVAELPGQDRSGGLGQDPRTPRHSSPSSARWGLGSPARCAHSRLSCLHHLPGVRFARFLLSDTGCQPGVQMTK